MLASEKAHDSHRGHALPRDGRIEHVGLHAVKGCAPGSMVWRALLCLFLTDAMLWVSCGLLTPMASLKTQELNTGNKLTVTSPERRGVGG